MTPAIHLKTELTDEERQKLIPIVGSLTVSNKQWTWSGSGIVGDTEVEDIDLIVLDEDKKLTNICHADYRNWHEGGSVFFNHTSDFKSFKSIGTGKTFGTLRPINLILCHTPESYKKYFDATQILWKAQLKEKWQRIELFQYMRDERPMNHERFVKLSSGDVKGLTEAYDEVHTMPF